MASSGSTATLQDRHCPVGLPRSVSRRGGGLSMAKREIKPIYWKDGCLFVLDQRQLPDRQVYLRCRDMRSVAAAIKDMALRGAPLIGGAAAYGFVLAAKALKGKDARRWAEQIEAAAKHLRAARPTAVNLMYSVDRMSQVTRNLFFQHAGESRNPDSSGCVPRLAPGRRETLINLLKEEADRIFKEDADANRRMADFGANLLPANSNVITICNTGALATCGIGTAFGVIRRAHELGKIRHVYACETRPYLQGSRLTMWELMQNGIPASLITDNMAAHIMATEKISAVLAGADRIAANAD